jgi:hypothetical protein
VERMTGIEPATFALAEGAAERNYETSEPATR